MSAGTDPDGNAGMLLVLAPLQGFQSAPGGLLSGLSPNLDAAAAGGASQGLGKREAWDRGDLNLRLGKGNLVCLGRGSAQGGHGRGDSQCPVPQFQPIPVWWGDALASPSWDPGSPASGRPPRMDEGLWHPGKAGKGVGCREVPVERCAWFGNLTGGLGEGDSHMERGGQPVKVRKAPVPVEAFLDPWGAHGEHPSAPAVTLLPGARTGDRAWLGQGHLSLTGTKVSPVSASSGFLYPEGLWKG